MTDYRAYMLLAARITLLTGIYCLTGIFGLSFAPVSGFATFVWPPTGIALAAIMLGGYRLWPGVFLGAFTVNLATGAPLLAALGMGVGNTLESVLGIFALRYFGPPLPFSFKKLRDTLRFIGFAALGATAISATIGIASLWASEIIHSSDLFVTWRAWWIGDALSALVITPLLVLWLTDPRDEHTTESRLEGLLAAGIVIFANIIVFFGNWDLIAPVFSLIVMPLIWCIFRFGARGSAAAMFAIVIIAITSTLMPELSTFMQPTVSNGLLLLQLFLASLAGTFLIFAAVVEERAQMLTTSNRLLAETKQAITLRDEFISIASHELKTPLTSLKLYAQIIQGQITADIPPPLARSFGKMGAQIDRLTQLVEDLLDISKIELGRLAFAHETFDLSELVNEIVEDFQSSSAKHAIRTEAEKNIRVTGDRNRISQVLTNVLANAIKYSPMANEIHVSVTRGPHDARITVRDFGIGIASGNIDKIFERFYRIGNENDRTFPGLGVGLYISREIIERHGGTIVARSELGKGSSFTITLPFIPQEQEWQKQ